MSLRGESFGAGPDVVFVHGWSWHAEVWRDMADVLARRYRVWLPDLPGHGRNGGVRAAIQNDSLGALCGEVPPNATWIGWSLGGLVALAAARDGVARRLVLIGATPRFVAAPDWDCAWSRAEFEQFCTEFEQDAAAALARFASLHLAGTAGERPLLRRLRAEQSRYGAPDVDGLRAGLRVLEETDLRPVLGEIAVPTLVVHGARDRIVPPRASEQLARSMPCATYVGIAEAGHALPLSHAETLVKVIEEHGIE